MDHRKLANAIRFLAIDMVEQAKSGHPGMPLGFADVLTVLFRDHLRYAPKHHDWLNRDRFILSAGHGSASLYALLYLTGYEGITLEDLKNFRQLGSKAAGHPEYKLLEGVETTTGPLGQGLANAVGMAIAENIARHKFGTIIGHKIYVVVGDGCLIEGISQEAISLAGHLQLANLIVLFDDNEISIDGATSLTISEDHVKRFQACGWETMAIDGHNELAISQALTKAKSATKPVFIACKTTIGYGSPNKSGSAEAHGAPLGAPEVVLTRDWLKWPHTAFEVPADILKAWRDIGHKRSEEYFAWQDEYHRISQQHRNEILAYLNNELNIDIDGIFTHFKKEFAHNLPHEPTRKSSGRILEKLIPAIPYLVGGSADLTASNNTLTSHQHGIIKGDFSGRYIYYGTREHAMAAIMNGMALYGGVIPYGGTFLVFSDYCRAAIRLSALMKLQVIYVMTHDSIGVGEDGPTHQPIEHLASLRAMPNLYVYRPCDATETAECWQLALAARDAPSLLALTRQEVKPVREHYTQENLCALGAYILAEDTEISEVTIFASGSEVAIAVEVRKTLLRDNIKTRIISVPCFEKFSEASKEYQVSLLCNKSLKVAIEAGVKQGWERFIGPHGLFFGLDSYGVSAPGNDVYQRFNLTTDYIAQKIKQALES